MTDFNALSVADAMIAYADHDISCFPCKGKHPLTAHGHKDATRSPEQIQAWAVKKPSAVGIPTGKQNGFYVLDTDVKNNGLENLKLLEQEHGALPETLAVKTGGGGTHYYFRCPDFEVKNSVGEIAAGIDIRGEGGYIIAPPSLHASGQRYCFTEAVDPKRFADLPEAPEWLLQRLQPEPQHPSAKPSSFWHELISNGAGEGQRNSSLAQLTGHLLAHKIDPHIALYIVEQWSQTKCYPPLSKEEAHQVFESIAKLETQKRRKS